MFTGSHSTDAFRPANSSIYFCFPAYVFCFGFSFYSSELIHIMKVGSLLNEPALQQGYMWCEVESPDENGTSA